jgi:dTDP-4-dehydrorhamnose 3,5-epimerase
LKFTPAELDGAYIIDIERIEDERGFFARVFCTRELRKHKLDPRVVQCNISWNKKSGTLRGLHYQAAPDEETKIVRVTRGAIWDVIVDLRPDSPTFEKWTGVKLSARNRRMLYIPKGFAHGFITLTNNTEVFYWMGHPHKDRAACGVKWNDPTFKIKWPIKPAVISKKDRQLPKWR